MHAEQRRPAVFPAEHARSPWTNVQRATAAIVAALVLSYAAARRLAPGALQLWGWVLIVGLLTWAVSAIWMVSPSRRRFHTTITVGAAVSTIVFLSAPAAGGVGALMILLGVLLSVAAGIVEGVRGLLRRQATRASALIPGAALVYLGAVLVVADNLIAVPLAVPPEEWAVDRQLAYMSQTDQADRRAARIVVDGRRDRLRRARVLALDAAGAITGGLSAYHAALILQHGDCSTHFRRAYELAQAASSGGVDATWLARAAWDRWQMSMGRPGAYGTQKLLSVSAGDCH
jgi:hypothetical protein